MKLYTILEHHNPPTLREVEATEGPKTYTVQERGLLRQRIDKDRMYFNGHWRLSAAQAWADYRERLVTAIETAEANLERLRRNLEIAKKEAGTGGSCVQVSEGGEAVLTEVILTEDHGQAESE